MGRATTLDADALVDTTAFDTNAGDGEVKADAEVAKNSDTAMVGANFIVVDDRRLRQRGGGALMDGTPSKFYGLELSFALLLDLRGGFAMARLWGGEPRISNVMWSSEPET